MKFKSYLPKLSFIAFFVLFCGLPAAAQTSFTYQGKLNDGGAPANGPYDFTFRLFSVAAGGAQIGTDVVRDDVAVTNGTFTVNLDFGTSPFSSGAGNHLEILVRPGASTGAYTTLTPRLPVASAPYSVKSLSADNAATAVNATTATNAANSTTAQNALNLGGVAASQFVTPGLALVRRLRPVSFSWKSNGQKDFGLVAEEVAAVEPLLTTTNAEGEIEGVKYDRVGVILVNAVNEQQEEIAKQQKRIDEQQETIRRQQAEIDRQKTELEALKELVCAQNPAAAVCRQRK